MVENISRSLSSIRGEEHYGKGDGDPLGCAQAQGSVHCGPGQPVFAGVPAGPGHALEFWVTMNPGDDTDLGSVAKEQDMGLAGI